MTDLTSQHWSDLYWHRSGCLVLPVCPNASGCWLVSDWTDLAVTTALMLGPDPQNFPRLWCPPAGDSQMCSFVNFLMSYWKWSFLFSSSLCTLYPWNTDLLLHYKTSFQTQHRVWTVKPTGRELDVGYRDISNVLFKSFTVSLIYICLLSVCIILNPVFVKPETGSQRWTWGCAVLQYRMCPVDGALHLPMVCI